MQVVRQVDRGWMDYVERSSKIKRTLERCEKHSVCVLVEKRKHNEENHVFLLVVILIPK